MHTLFLFWGVGHVTAAFLEKLYKEEKNVDISLWYFAVSLKQHPKYIYGIDIALQNAAL